MWIIGAITIFTSLVAVWHSNQPVDIQLSLQEQSVKNKYLPPLHDAVVILTLGEENKSDTISSLADKARFFHIPHRYHYLLPKLHASGHNANIDGEY